MGLTKLIVNIPDTVINDLYYLAGINHTSLTAQIIESIKINKFLVDKEKCGYKILVEKSNGEYEIINQK